MTRLTRYLLREVLGVFFLTLIGMTAVMMIAGVLQEALRQGLGIAPILKIIPYLLPNALRFAVPGTILFAACIVYGRISSANEVVAVKALGIHPMVLVWPTLIVAFLISLIAVWLNDVAVSWGRQGVRRVALRSLEQIAYGMLTTQRAYTSDRFSITVMDVDGKTLIEPTLTFFGMGGGETLVLKASEARLHFDAKDGVLEIEMLNGRVMVGDKLTYRAPGITRERIPLGLNNENGRRSPSHYPLRLIPREIRDQRRELEKLEQQMAAEAAFELARAAFDQFTTPQWEQKVAARRDAQSRVYRLQTEPWRRWANGFSCFFFVLVGVPLAIRLRNSDFWTTFGLCFLPILLGYYPLLAFGADRAKAGDLPPYVVWLGNAVLCLVGLGMLKRVIRY